MKAILMFLALPLSAHATTLECRSPGQKIHGAPYTEISGTIHFDLEEWAASIDLRETTLRPFDPFEWKLGRRNLAITSIADSAVPDPSHVKLVLTMDLSDKQNGVVEDFVIEAVLPRKFRSEGSSGVVPVTASYHYDRWDTWDRVPDHIQVSNSFSTLCKIKETK